MSSRTRIAIIGVDSAAIHLFNQLYKNDDRYEVCMFVYTDHGIPQKMITNLSSGLTGNLYPSGIPIIYDRNFSKELSKRSIDKAVISPNAITEGSYLDSVSQIMAYDCPIITPSLKSLSVNPSKACVSIYSDTNFDSVVIQHVVKLYMVNSMRPAIIFPMPVWNSQENIEILIDSPKKLDLYYSSCDIHTYKLISSLLSLKIPIYMASDIEELSNTLSIDDSVDLFLFIGSNHTPCFFQSHFSIYICDDMTFGDDIFEHPSVVHCQNSNLIILLDLINKPDAVNPIREVTSAKIIKLASKYSDKNLGNYTNRTCITIDDSYPKNRTTKDTLSRIISIKHFMHPIQVQNTQNKDTLYYPLYHNGMDELNTYLQKKTGFDVVVTTVPECTDIIAKKYVMKIVFTFSLDDITMDSIRLPPSAFIRKMPN